MRHLVESGRDMSIPHARVACRNIFEDAQVGDGLDDRTATMSRVDTSVIEPVRYDGPPLCPADRRSRASVVAHAATRR